MPVYDRSQRIPEWRTFEVPFPYKGASYLLPAARTPDGAAPVLDDFDIDHLVLKKRWGEKALGGTVAGRVQRFVSFVTIQGNRPLVSISTTNLHSYDGGTWTSRISGLTGVPDIIPSWTAFQNKLIVCNGVNRLIKWDGVTASASLISTSPFGRAVGTLGGRVLVGRIDDGSGNIYANRIQWSDFLLEEVWSGGTSGQADLIDTNDEIMAFARLRDQLAIIRKDSLWTAAIADAPTFYRFERQYDGLGTIASGSVVPIPGGVGFLGPDDYYIFNGNTAFPLLPREYSLRKLLEEQVSLDGRKRVVAMTIPSRGQIWLLLPLGGGTSITHTLVLNYNDRTVRRYTFDWSGIGVGEVAIGGSGFWSEYDNVWAAYDIPWSLMTTETQERIVGCNESTVQPVVYDPALNDQGAAITGVWRLPLLNFASEEVRGTDLKMVHRVRVIGEAGSSPFKIRVGYSHDGQTINWTPYFTVDVSQSEWIFDPSMPTEAMWWTAEIVDDTLNGGVRVASVIFHFTVTSPGRPEIRPFVGVRE